MYYGSIPNVSQLGSMNFPTGKGKSAARMAAIIATILGLLLILFNNWPLAPEMNELLAKIASKQKTYQILATGILAVESLLGIYLAKCVISMTGNTAGRWAGTLLSIVRTVGLIYYGTILGYVLSESRPSRSFFFNTEEFTIAFSIGSAVLLMVAGFCFIKAVKGSAKGLLSVGYVIAGLSQLVYFLLSTYGKMGYDSLITLTKVYGIITILAIIIIVIGYYVNIRTYDDADPNQQPNPQAQAPYGQQTQYYQPYQQGGQPYQQQPGQPYYNPQTPYQQPRQQAPYQQPAQQAPYQQPAQQAPYQQPYGPQPQQPYGQPPQQPYGPQTQQQPPQQRPPQPPQPPYPPRQNPPRPTPPPPPAP